MSCSWCSSSIHNVQRCNGPRLYVRTLMNITNIYERSLEVRELNLTQSATLFRELMSNQPGRRLTLQECKRGGKRELHQYIIDELSERTRRESADREQMARHVVQFHELRNLLPPIPQVPNRVWTFTIDCITPSTEEKFVCYICQDEKENREKVKLCSCAGNQCYTCFEDYVNRNLRAPSCPMCRKQIDDQSIITLENPEIVCIFERFVQ